MEVEEVLAREVLRPTLHELRAQGVEVVEASVVVGEEPDRKDAALGAVRGGERVRLLDGGSHRRARRQQPRVSFRTLHGGSSESLAKVWRPPGSSARRGRRIGEAMADSIEIPSIRLDREAFGRIKEGAMVVLSLLSFWIMAAAETSRRVRLVVTLLPLQLDIAPAVWLFV